MAAATSSSNVTVVRMLEEHLDARREDAAAGPVADAVPRRRYAPDQGEIYATVADVFRGPA